jgi:hypothetical protein
VVVTADPYGPATELRNEPPAGAPGAMRALVEATAGDPAVRGLTVAVGDREAAGPGRLDVRVEVGPGADDTRIEAACRAAIDASGLPYDFGLDHTR